MSLRRIGIASFAALALMAASIMTGTGAADGAARAEHHGPGTATNPQVLVTFPPGDLGQFAESMVADHDGNLFVSVTAWKDAAWNKGQIWKITPRGVATKFGPELDVGMLTGLAFDDHGRLYAGLNTFGDPAAPSGVLRIDARSATQVLSLPVGQSGIASFPNGLAFHDDDLYVSDSTLGAIWRTRPHRNVNDVQTVPWLQDGILAPTVGWEGINGIAINATGIDAVVADTGLVVRVPFLRHDAPGAMRTIAADPLLTHADGVAYARDGSLWVVTNGDAAATGSVLKVSPRGHITVVAQDPGWLDYPTQLVFGTDCGTTDTLYISNGGFNNVSGISNVIAWHLDTGVHH
jgi:glucose/arabinose dehydrogenase